MTINLQKPDITELKPRITVFGVGGGGGNAVNNMIASGLDGVEFVVANTDAQALTMSKAERLIQLGVAVTEGLGAGSQPEVGAAAAEECIDEINDHLSGTHMAFVTAGMGGGTGTGAAPVVARAAREAGILTVGVVTKPFSFEGKRRMALAEDGIGELQKHVDTLIVIPNQNLFRVASEKTTFAEAFSMADQVLYSGVACITDLMVKEGLINLDFADVRSVMRAMGRAMMGTGEASGEGRAMAAAEAAISNPLLDETSMSGADGLLISITGGRDMTLFEVDEAATRIREEVDVDANIILGATFDESLEGIIRVSVVATGIEAQNAAQALPDTQKMNDAAERLRQSAKERASALAGASAGTLAGAAVAKTVQPAAAATPANAQQAAVATKAAPIIERQPAVAPSAIEIAENAISDDDFQAAFEEEIALTAHASVAATPAQPVATPSMQDIAKVARHAVPQSQQAKANAADDAGAIGLLRRLASGLSATPEERETYLKQPSTQPAQPTQTVHQPTQAATTPVPAQQQAHQRPVPGDQPAYSAPQNGALDVHGRAAQTPRLNADEDPLDIPAFLRRQAN
ncbi:MAG: cell division protein FtsZ [Pseudomonadota bacterium]